MSTAFVSPWVRFHSLLLLIAGLGCSSSAPWRPPDRSASWDTRPADWLLAHQNPDGSWGEQSKSVGNLPIGRVGVTTFALHAILGYGYTQLSKDERLGVSVGPGIRRGLDWLMGLQRPDGSFRDAVSDFEGFLVAEFLLWNYSYTADPSVKSSAGSALASVTGKRRTDGTWGSPESTFMAMAVLEAARMAEDLDYDSKARDEVLKFMDGEFDSSPNRYNAIAPFIRHYRGPDRLRRRSLDWVMKRVPDPKVPDFAGVYFGSILVYGVTMYPDPEWLRWTQALEAFTESTVSEDGSWRGCTVNETVVRTAFVASCHVSYRGSRKFEPVFGPK